MTLGSRRGRDHSTLLGMVSPKRFRRMLRWALVAAVLAMAVWSVGRTYSEHIQLQQELAITEASSIRVRDFERREAWKAGLWEEQLLIEAQIQRRVEQRMGEAK